MPAGDRDRLERVCRYALRPPVSDEWLRLAPAADVVLQLRRPWDDSTTDWVVYAKRPFAGPAQVLEYVRRYTRRPCPRVSLARDQ